MGLRRDLRVRLRDLSVRPDDVGDPARELRLRVFARSVRHADVALHVAEERERKVELLREAGVLLDRVEGGPQDLGVLLLEFRVEVAEPATLGRSTGGVGLRIEPEDDVLPLVIGEAPPGARVVLHVESRSGVSHLQHLRPPQKELQKSDDHRLPRHVSAVSS